MVGHSAWSQCGTGFIRRVGRQGAASNHSMGGGAARSARQAHAMPLDGLEEAGNDLGLLHLQQGKAWHMAASW